MEKPPPNEPLSRPMEMTNARQTGVSAIRVCSLSDYRGYVRRLPRPSEEQIEDYVQFVSGAHSWYKHLPLLPPGEPFRFFVDPLSGFDRVIQRDGSVIHQERTDTSLQFHYTWMTTKEYRRRFAYLAYTQDAAPEFLILSQGSTRTYADLPVFTTPEGAYHIPPEVAEAGLVELTSVIHPRMDVPEMWYIALECEADGDPEGPSRQWPLETGGEETLRQIKEVCARLNWRPFLGDTDLAVLVLPEKRRLQKNMTEAINRMLTLLYGGEQ